ncbi:hypothetical protein K388_05842 [Streptomyces sp. KhCrAH-43]|uniref:hypothetical protein n=1 Tax=unclassified Streptomyces TaxID=2593676 RepID=UPI000377DC67|nr:MULTISPECIES: hypothetical protein [unclassified Streptomyces]MYS33511.1 hypothetical protein [Streptomyces sp. SID4920]MYX63897.1 hypothetical protein [Streptomyces sp. SID8373]RAJ52743.1 hypothetical protein K388_05842 [Streptomyces sp. KhCrAH-43]
MGDKVISERLVGTSTVHGRTLEVHRLTWRDAPGLSYDVVDGATGELLTVDESFDEVPRLDQLCELLEAQQKIGTSSPRP